MGLYDALDSFAVSPDRRNALKVRLLRTRGKKSMQSQQVVAIACPTAVLASSKNQSNVEKLAVFRYFFELLMFQLGKTNQRKLIFMMISDDLTIVKSLDLQNSVLRGRICVCFSGYAAIVNARCQIALALFFVRYCWHWQAQVPPLLKPQRYKVAQQASRVSWSPRSIRRNVWRSKSS